MCIRDSPTALREDRTPSPAHRLEMLRETFQGMEVSVEFQGALPEDGAAVSYSHLDVYKRQALLGVHDPGGLRGGDPSAVHRWGLLPG